MLFKFIEYKWIKTKFYGKYSNEISSFEVLSKMQKQMGSKLKTN